MSQSSTCSSRPLTASRNSDLDVAVAPPLANVTHTYKTMHTLSTFMPAVTVLLIYFAIGLSLNLVTAALFALLVAIASGLIIAAAHFRG